MRRPLSILDLLVVTLVFAVHLFHFPLAVLYRESNLIFLVPLAPTLIAIWIHIRVKPTVRQAIFVHYVVCVSWAFLYGYGYALAANRDPESRFREEPIEMAVYVAEQMAVFAVLTSLLYGIVGYCVQLTIRRSKTTRLP